MKNFQLALAALIIFLGLTIVETANAATILVTNTNDSGTGSLRQAIQDSNFNNQEDVIEFDLAVFSTLQTIVLTTGELFIAPDNSSGATKTLTINGTGANLLTISGNNQSRVFSIAINASAVIKRLKITGGNGVGTTADDFNNSGGGIFVRGGVSGENQKSLILKDSIVSGNNTTNQFGSGGGIGITGPTLIINSTISNNTSLAYGGGISIYGGEARIINSTISGNTTNFGGGGIYNNTSTVYLTSSTLVFNRAVIGGGIYLTTSIPVQSVFFYAKNSIIAQNTVDDDFNGNDIYGLTRSEGFNIIGNTTGTSIYGVTTGNQLDTNPQLDPQLKTNGGIIPTHALAANSSAIDSGDNCILETPADGGCSDPIVITDERGVARPQDGDGNGTPTVDIGAFEATRAEILLAPPAPDLQVGSDTGASSTDNVTSSNNLVFDATGVTVGAFVEFMRDGAVIAGTTANTSNIVFSDTGASNGVHLYSLRQTVNNLTSLQGASLAVRVDRAPPLVTINQANGQAEPTRNQPINFTVVFNEEISGFEAADVSLAASTAGVSSVNVVVTGGGATYNIAVSNITSDGIVRAVVVPNAVVDLAGNSSLISTSTDNSVTFDTTSPTVTINQAANQTDPTRSSTVNFTVVFSEVVNGFVSASISLAGSTANISSASVVVTGSGTTYNVAVNNVTSNGGFVRAAVNPFSAIDLASNFNNPSTSTDNQVTVDNISPTVTINQAVGQSDPAGTLPVNYTVVFSEAVTGFDSADVSLSGSTLNTTGATVTVTGSGATYNVAVSGIAANNGVLRANVRSSAATDLAGNFSFSSTSTDNQVTVDTVAPTVSINQAIGQSDPSAAQPVNFTVVFSELVSGFSASDVSLAGSTANVSAAVITISGGGNVYNVAVGNITSSGQVRASVVAGAAQDAVGNLNAASTSSDNTITVTVNSRRALFDFDGDGKSDLSVFRPEGGAWYLLNSTTGFTGVQFGVSTDKLVPADYDGDGKTDVAVYRSGIWYLQRSQAGFTGISYGDVNDIPQPADFDGDGKSELAVYRPSNGTWYIYNLANNQTNAVQFGASEDKPVAADYDGDGKADVAVFRPSNGTWYLQRSQAGFFGIAFGDSNDKLVPADYDGDGKADIAVFRPSNGTWYLWQSTTGFTGFQFGQNGDKPVAADYDGDGRADAAVYRDGIWYLQRSTAGFTGIAFGTSTDSPIPFAFVP